MLIACVMRNAWTHKIQWSGPTVHSSTVTGLNNILQPTFFTVVNNIEQYLFTVGPNTSMLAVKFFSPVFVIFDHFHSPKR